MQTLCHLATKKIEKKEVNCTYIVKIFKIFVKILKGEFLIHTFFGWIYTLVVLVLLVLVLFLEPAGLLRFLTTTRRKGVNLTKKGANLKFSFWNRKIGRKQELGNWDSL